MARTLITTLQPTTDTATYSLTDNGAGKRRYIAEITYPNEDAFETEVMELDTCTLYDEGTTSNHQDLFSPMTSTTFIRGNNGTNVHYENTGSSQWQSAFPNTIYTTGGYVIEMEITSSSYFKAQISTYETGKSNYYDAYDGELIQGTGTFKWVFNTNGKVYWYKNDTLIRTSNSSNTERFSFFFQCPVNKTLDFTYKNFKVYPSVNYLFYDDGVTSPKTATWNNYSDRLTVTVNSTNGTTILRDASSGTGYYFADNSTTTGFYDFTLPIIIEFDVGTISNKSYCGLDFATSGGDNNKTFNALNIAENDSIKVVYDGTTIKVYKNGSTTSTDVSLSLTGSVGVGFFIGSTQSVTFKNFKIYNG